MIRQGEECVLIGHLLDVIQPPGEYAILQQSAVRHSGEHGALGGDVARDLDLTHDLTDLDELRRTGVRMLFKTPAFRPAIRVVAVADLAQQEIGRRLVHDHAHALVDPNRPEVLVPSAIYPMELQSRLRRIELKNECIRLRGPLLLAVQPGEALDRVSAMRRSTADPLPSGERSCQIARAITPSRPDGHTTVTEYYLGTIQLPQIDPFSMDQYGLTGGIGRSEAIGEIGALL